MRLSSGSEERRQWSHEPDHFRVELLYRERVDYPVKVDFLLRVESRDPARWKIFDSADDATAWLAPLGSIASERSSILAVREKASSGTRAAFLVEVDLERQSVLVDWPNKWLAVHPNPLYQREFGPDFGRRFCMDPEPVLFPEKAAQPPTYPGLAEDTYIDLPGLPGVRLFYVDSGGSGPPVILLHSATGSSRVWEHQMPALTAAGYRVVAYDRRGFGRTVVRESAPEASAADDLEALRAGLGIDRFHLLGTAAGGMVAVDYAQSYPERLLRLVVANSIVGVQDEEYLELSRRLRPPEFARLPPDLRELGPSYRAANPEGTKRWLELETVSRAPGTAPPAQPFKNRTTFRSLESIDIPTLLITGGADLYTPPPVLRLFAERIPRSEVVILPEVGHAGHWEAPAEFNHAVLDFLTADDALR